MIRTDGQQGNFRADAAADFFEAVEVGAVAGVIDAAALVFEDEAAVAAVLIVQRARAPVFTGNEGDFPIVVRKAFPPFEFDDALEAEVEGEVANAPGHDGDFRVRQSAEGGFVKMIEVRVREQDEVDGRQVLDFEAGAFDAFEEEKPVGEIGIDEDVEVGELQQKGRVTDPGDGDLAVGEFWKCGFALLAGAAREQSFPNHFMEERARVEMFGGRQVLEGLGQLLAGRARLFWHNFLLTLLLQRIE